MDILAHMLIDPRVSQALGKTREEIAAMGLREFFDLCHDRGYSLSVASQPAVDEGRLSVVMADSAEQVTA